MSTLAERLDRVVRRIGEAAERSGRSPSAVTLIAVGKTRPAAALAQAVAAGAADLGENRVQEASAKRDHVAGATWHLIGPLQRNKVKVALEIFDVIHTVDRPQIALRLQHLLAEHWSERRLPVLIEVNAGEEPQKAGVLPDEAAELVSTVLCQPQLELCGLMAIPPFTADPEDTRPYFRALRTLRDALREQLGHPLPHLSMGMSHDYEVAIEEGATMIRVGTAIFGVRR